MPRHRMALSVKEQAFVRHFLAGQLGIRGNARRAYIAAGYAPKAAASGASELLRKDRVQKTIAAHLRKADLTVERTLEECRRIAFSDMRDYATWGSDGVRLFPSESLDDETAPVVREVIEHRTRRTTTRHTRAVGKPGEPAYVPPGEVTTVREDVRLRLRLYDKLAALTTIAQYLGILKGTPEQIERPLLPRGFFEAIIMGDVDRIKGFLPEGTDVEALMAEGDRPPRPTKASRPGGGQFDRGRTITQTVTPGTIVTP